MINLNNIKAELVRQDITLEEISIVINKTYSTTTKKIRGTTPLTAEELGLIAKHLNVDINLFYN